MARRRSRDGEPTAIPVGPLPASRSKREIPMNWRDVTQTNRVARQMIEKTEDPRHRFLLMSYDRHRNLEMAGRYEELFAPDMMAERPVYHLHANETNATLT